MMIKMNYYKISNFERKAAVLNIVWVKSGQRAIKMRCNITNIFLVL